MTSVDASEREPASRGELRFVEPHAFAQIRGTAAAASMLYSEMPFVSAAVRGQLGEFIEAAIEDELARRGVPRSSTPSPELPQTVADQLARARSVGFRGLVVAIGSLAEIAGPSRVLDPDDCAALRGWVSASRSLPITVLLDRSNLHLLGFAAPQRLDALLGWTDTERPRKATERKQPAAPRAPKAPELRVIEGAPDRPRADEAKAAPAPPAPPAPSAPPAPVTPTQPPPRPPIDTRLFADELLAARGPKPLGVVERLFLTRYVPLLSAEVAGQLDAYGRQVRAEWAANFSRSYSESFQALRVTGKRPAMVFDVPQLASRVARLHGARSVELMLVDSMRYDLGLMVQERLQRLFEGRGACAETMLLWAALPSTTATQLDLLAHGMEALNRPLPQEDPDSVRISRGRSVAIPRRVKVGQRDLVKIDAVEARLREAGPPLPERLEQVADEVASSVARHADTLAERTLLVVFGDHGFTTDGASLLSPSRQGGASPEEVLVPGFAWLMGGMH